MKPTKKQKKLIKAVQDITASWQDADLNSPARLSDIDEKLNQKLGSRHNKKAITYALDDILKAVLKEGDNETNTETD